MEIKPMTKMFAREVVGWRYPGEYALYDMQEGAEEELLDYYALTEEGVLTGFFCFGLHARVPLAKSYEEGPLDIGLGMAPALCGQGKGAAFVRAGLAFAKVTFGARVFRLTVASFNKRAVKVYEKLGFRTEKQVTHQMTGREFIVMTLKVQDE